MTGALRAISADDLAWARNDDADPWSVGNQALYDFCRTHPTHTAGHDVIAKIWLIGRAYSAALERSASASDTKEPVEELYGRSAVALSQCGLDQQLAALGSEGPQSVDDLQATLKAHGCLLAALMPMMRTIPRSFASKYLHFHKPQWFFIYDSISARGLSRIVGRFPVEPQTPRGVDSVYAAHVARVWHLRERLAHASLPLSPREMDRLLLRCGT